MTMSRLPGTLLCSVQCARASYIRLPKHVRLLEVRAFATHRDIPATSPILSQHFEGRSNTGGGSVGPFQLGISQDSRQENVKKWRDLSPGGKGKAVVFIFRRLWMKPMLSSKDDCTHDELGRDIAGGGIICCSGLCACDGTFCKEFADCAVWAGM